MKVPVVDNGGQWTHREYRVLRDLGAETRIVPNTIPFDELDADGVVLSGGALSVEGSDAPLGRIADWIDRIDRPVLGICVGHQFLARHFGGTVERAPQPEFGRVDVTVEAPDHPVFAGLPDRLKVWASHNDRVARLPDGWARLARSEACPVQAMAHPTRPIVGVQFHPEVEHTEGGREILAHFLAMCRR
ncbi:MAG TPA: GMP synthase subunit A [Thermoplasmata archaeon]|nr:GMP synthase subunit A [Thermoplasmata archaeon]HUJ78348.1 GMP synthase subunit A [Thermoplasmata archaeon]